MPNFTTVLITTKDTLGLRQDSLKSDGQQFCQYQSSEQSPLILTHWTQKRQLDMMLEIQFLTWETHKPNACANVQYLAQIQHVHLLRCFTCYCENLTITSYSSLNPAPSFFRLSEITCWRSSNCILYLDAICSDGILVYTSPTSTYSSDRGLL